MCGTDLGYAAATDGHTQTDTDRHTHMLLPSMRYCPRLRGTDLGFAACRRELGLQFGEVLEALVDSPLSPAPEIKDENAHPWHKCC
eukprot:1420496-Rhodomonas_salina.2